MSLAAGTKPNPYEILSLLDACGRGEVYRAVNMKLDHSAGLIGLLMPLAVGTGWVAAHRGMGAGSQVPITRDQRRTVY